MAENELGSSVEMAKGQRHCGRVVVSDLWIACPFCGDSLTKKASASSPANRTGRQSSVIDLNSLTVRELRAYLAQNGAKVSGKKSELIDRLANLISKKAELKFDF